MSDALTDRRCFRILAVIDDFKRVHPMLGADTSQFGHRVAREPDQIIAERGMPETIASDKSTGFSRMAVVKWVQETGMDWQYIAPESRGKTASPKACTTSCAMNALINRYLPHCVMLEK